MRRLEFAAEQIILLHFDDAIFHYMCVRTIAYYCILIYSVSALWKYLVLQVGALVVVKLLM